MLGKHISYKTIIPDYIVEALVFAKEFYSLNIIADIIEYRVNKKTKDGDKIDFTKLNEVISNYRVNQATIDEVIVEIKNTIGEAYNQVLTFIEKVK